MSGQTDYAATNEELEARSSYDLMILIDTSAWIEFFRKSGSKHINWKGKTSQIFIPSLFF